LHFGGSGIYASTNEGITWENFSQGLPFLNNIEKLIVYNNKIFAATSLGLWQRDISKIIPVELISFNALVSGNNITLSWSTASETNNMGFEVERQVLYTGLLSESSEYGVGRWERVGFLEGKGTTAESQFYSFVDQNLNPGSYFYRLKQVDFDGSFEYSSIVEIEAGTPDEFYLGQNYPNPFNPRQSCHLSLVPAYPDHW
jgi:hypothetical protein